MAPLAAEHLCFTLTWILNPSCIEMYCFNLWFPTGFSIYHERASLYGQQLQALMCLGNVYTAQCPKKKKKKRLKETIFFFIRNFHPKRPNYSFGPHTFVTVSIQSLYIYGKSIVFIPKLCMKFIFCPWTLKNLFFVPELWKNSFLHMNFFILKKSSGTKFMCKNELFKVQGRKSNFIQSLGTKTIV